jgi:DNA-binding NarL/FixJ family response regulator/tetratricopeptide (TPR) repeat protein
VLVGRELECARIDRLLAQARSGRAGSLVVRGEPGIGKSALLDYAETSADGMSIVRALGIESEAELEFSGLLEVCRPLLDAVDELPGTQDQALRGALGLGPAHPRERFTIGAATLTLLASAGERAPLLVIVDDAHWLDGASADALLFAARRLEADAVAILFAAREADGRGFAAAGVEEVLVGALEREAALELLGGTEAAIAPSVADSLRAATQGNPLALIELPRLLSAEQLAGRQPIDEPLPTPATLEVAFTRRAALLPAGTRRALVIATVLSSGEVETVAAALATAGLEMSALEPAEDLDLIHVADGRLRFRHPLVRSALYQGATSSERRAAHRAAAHALAGPAVAERRAWHLAAAALGPDESVASELEIVGREAVERTGYAAAAAALARAAQLTPDQPVRVRRLYEAARAAWHAGQTEHALELLAEPLADPREPLTRAAAVHLRAQIEYLSAGVGDASGALLDAARLVETERPDRAVRMLIDACEASLYGGAVATGLVAARRARELAPTDGGENDCLVELALGEALIMSPRLAEATERLEHGVTLAEQIHRHTDARCLTRASIALGWLDRPREGRVLAMRAVEVARERGGTGLLPYAIEVLAWHNGRLGLWQSAYAESLEALALAEETGQRNMVAHCLMHMAAIDAARGHEAPCRRQLDRALAIAQRSGLAALRLRAHCVDGLLDLGLGRLAPAIDRLQQTMDEVEALGLYEREASPWADLVEAYARRGDTSSAEATLARFEAARLQTSPTWPRAVAAGCRGRLASTGAFDEHYAEALALHAAIGDPFAVARTRLSYGERLRRSGRRTDARGQLRAALATFDELAAAPWGERARAELRASGETARRRDISTGDELTPQELQVAAHVADGKTNREVGAALFLSHKTIESHLARIFRKLGIHSRAELIRLSAMHPDTPIGIPAPVSARRSVG